MSEAPRQIRLVRDCGSGVEAVQARFKGHAYDMHRHDEWLVGVTDDGVQDFHCRGVRQRSTTDRVILIEPEEAHDGEAGAADGFAYSMLYLPRHWLRASLADCGSADPAFRSSLADNSGLARAIRGACRALADPHDGGLRRDTALDAVVEALRPHLGRTRRSGAVGRAAIVARRARDRLQAGLAQDIGADALARDAGAANRFELARAFRAAFGTSPHAYLVQTRLLRARTMLAEGEPPAAIAAACGFADQSHLGRWFRRAYGLTPAAYRACCTNVPDRGHACG
jgi:AraC-like DNA-binding protein